MAERKTSERMQNPVVACAADNNYAMSLGVTMLSAAQHLRAGTRMQLYVMDGGLSDENRSKLEATWKDERIDLHWIKPDVSLVEDFMTSHHISSVAYFRILLPQVLPDSLDRVLYLDSDLLVLDDIVELWEMELGDWWAMAIPDIACPAIDAKVGLADYRASLPYLASLRPIRNYAEFGIDPNASYFNSGVMLMNLAAWRKHEVTEQLLQCLRDNGKYIWCWDQYALNAILSGKWNKLPFRWNMGTHAFEFPSVKHAPIDHDEFENAIENPSVVHFTTEFKPWHFDVKHPHRDRFYEFVDKTAWKGWRPTKPPFKFKTWMDRRGANVQKSMMITYRKLTT